jgi:hypothetical protein
VRAPLVQFGSTMKCPHGAAVMQAPSQSAVRAGGMPILLPQDAASIVGCPFTISDVPHPCVTVQWSGLATKSKLKRQAPLLATSVGVCRSYDGTPQGAVGMSGVQTKVFGQ